MDITLKTKTHLYEKNGHVFYNITGTQVDYTLDGLKLRLDNLFDGVKVLGMYNKPKRKSLNLTIRSDCEWEHVILASHCSCRVSFDAIIHIGLFAFYFDRGQYKSVFE